MLSFRQRVLQFWQAFATEEKDLHLSLKNGKKRPFQQRFSYLLEKAIDARFEIFPPAKKNAKYRIELSAQGNKLRAFLLEIFLELQPTESKLFEFSPFLSAIPLEKIPTVVIHQQPFKLDSMRFYIAPSTHGANYEIAVSYPPFKNLNKDDRLQLASHALDMFLGELWGNELLTIVRLTSDDIPLSLSPEELLQFMQDKIQEEEIPAIDSYFDLYVSFKNPHPSKKAEPILDDIIGGNSCIPKLMQDFFDIQEEKTNHAPYHALARNLGAEVGFVYFKSKGRTDIIESDRHFLEPLLRDRLDEAACGKVLGGAVGHEFCYVEILLTDTELAFTNIQNILNDFGVKGYYQSYHPQEEPITLFYESLSI